MLYPLVAATLVAFAPVPQDPKPGPVVYPKASTLVLPKATPNDSGKTEKTQKSDGKDTAADLLEQQRFENALARLRRSVLQNEGATEIELRRLGDEFPGIVGLALKVLRRADVDQVPALARVLRRFGKPENAETLQLALLTRPYGGATSELVVTLEALVGDAKKDVLMRLVEGPFTSLQTAARDQLVPLLVPEDVPALIALSRHKKLEVATRGIELLATQKEPRARTRLVEALGAQDVTLAQAAVAALLTQGNAVVPELLAIAEKPAVDFTFPWAAFVLSQIEERGGEPCISPKCVPNLLRELTTPEPFFQVTAALALARVAWRSQDTTGEPYRDSQVVDALLQVVAPKGFVVGFAQLERPVARTLGWFTGQDLRGAEAWRQWWKIAHDGYVGMRMRIEVTPQNVGFVTVTARDAKGEWRAQGEQVRSLPEAATLPFCVLDTVSMQALVTKLLNQGFMTDAPRHGVVATVVEALPAQRVQLEIGKARVATGFLAERVLNQLVLEVQRAVDAERWQLYRDPRSDGDFATFWKNEREWLAAHPAPADRSTRLKDRILTLVPRLEGEARLRAIEHLVTIPEVQKVLTERDGSALVAAAGTSQNLDDATFRLLELALVAPGEKAWREVLDLVDHRFEVGGKERLPRVFALLGADKVISAIEDGRPRIRLAATAEVANTKDLRAVPRLLDLVDGNDAELRNAAIFTLGKLKASAAREKLLRELPRFDETTRRVAWVALGRIGGDDVLVALRAAVVMPDEQDRLAGIQGLGELREAGASRLLAEIWAKSPDQRAGELALSNLRRQGAALARPALRPWLKSIDLRQRREMIAVLAELQDPEVVPYLIEASADRSTDAGSLIVQVAAVTGLDVSEINDRGAYLREWWRTHENQPQAAWYLELLRRENIESPLRVQDLEPGAGNAGVPELLRILTRITNPRVRVLTIAMLRQVTEQDFGALTLNSGDEAARSLADRYRFWFELQQAARK